MFLEVSVRTNNYSKRRLALVPLDNVSWSSDVMGPDLIGLHRVLLPEVVGITNGLSCSLNPCFW